MSKAKLEQNLLQNAAQFLKTKYDEFFKFTYKVTKTYEKDAIYEENFRYTNHLQDTSYITSKAIIDELRDCDKTGNYENLLLFLRQLNPSNIVVKFGENELSNVLIDSNSGESDKTIIACIADRYYAFKKNNPNSPATKQLEDILVCAKTHIKPGHYPIFNSFVSEYSLMEKYPNIDPIDFNKLPGRQAPAKSQKAKLPENNHNIAAAKEHVATLSLKELPVEMPVAAMHKVEKSVVAFAKKAEIAAPITHSKEADVFKAIGAKSTLIAEDRVLFTQNNEAVTQQKQKKPPLPGKENRQVNQKPVTLYEASMNRLKASSVKTTPTVKLSGIRLDNLKKFSDLIGEPKKDERLNTATATAMKFR